MAKVTLAKYMREQPSKGLEHHCGPFLTISRQYGCWGFSLGLLLTEILQEQSKPNEGWTIYHKDILEKLAKETDLAAELLEEQRSRKPRFMVDLFRSLSGIKVPSGYEIRNRITTIIRGKAIQGRAIIIGQGGAGATRDLPNGLSIRLEAPEDWRIQQICFRDGVTPAAAKKQIQEIETQREYLRKIYDAKFPHKPPFHLTYDCSVFTLAKIAQHVVYAMRLQGML